MQGRNAALICFAHAYLQHSQPVPAMADSMVSAWQDFLDEVCTSVASDLKGTLSMEAGLKKRR